MYVHLGAHINKLVAIKKKKMGVTIHFEGILKSENSFDKVIEIAKNFAVINTMEYDLFEESNKSLQRVKDEKDWDYYGLTRGIKIQPDENCEPLWLEFDKDNYVQEYCKTQFVEKEIHIKIIDLLRKIEPYFENLEITDEGEYWETGNSSLLQQHIDNCFALIEKVKKEDSSLSGPYRVEGNRIIDLM